MSASRLALAGDTHLNSAARLESPHIRRAATGGEVSVPRSSCLQKGRERPETLAKRAGPNMPLGDCSLWFVACGV